MTDTQVDQAIDPAVISERIVKRLQSFGRNRLLGSQLGQLINESLGVGQSYKALLPAGGPQTLLQFCATFLSDVVQPTGEFSGPDQWFRVNQIELQEWSGVLGSGSTWKAFVSLSPMHAVVLNSSRSDLLTAPIGSELPEGFLTIASLTLEEHKGVCEAFRLRLETEGFETAELTRILETYDSTSYAAWIAAIHGLVPRGDGEWSVFRRARIIDLFKKRLIDLGISESIVGTLVPQLTADQRRANLAQIAERQRVSAGAPQFDADARQFLHAVIDKLDLSQLRKIEIPFGAFLDAMNERHSR